MAPTRNEGSSPNDSERKPAPHIDTGGGAYVAGNVDTQGGHFVGRDLIVRLAIPTALAVVLAGSAVVVAVALGWELPTMVQVALCPYSEPQEELPNGVFNIAVAPFAAPDEDREATGSRLGRWLAQQIYDPTGTNSEGRNLPGVVAWSNDWPNARQIDPPMAPIPEENPDSGRRDRLAGTDCPSMLSANQWLDRLQAHLVLYGELTDQDDDEDETLLHLSFFYQAPVNNLPDITLGHHPFGRPIPIPNADSPALVETYLSDSAQLRIRVAALVQLVGALASLVNGNPGVALEKFEDAETQLDLATWREPEVSSTLYYFMGQTALQVPDLETARRAFQAVIDNGDKLDELDVILATVGLGNYNYLKAETLLLDALTRAEGRYCLALDVRASGEDACFEEPYLDNLLAGAASIPVTGPDVHTELRSTLAEAVRYYEDALNRVNDLGPDVDKETVQEIRGVAQVMLANAIRRTGDAYLNEFEEHTVLVDFDPDRINHDLADNAESYFMKSTDLFSQTVKLFQEIEKPGLAAYTFYGLGLANEHLACSRSSEDPDSATKYVVEASQSFAACAALDEPTDISNRLFEVTKCLCENAASRYK